MSSVKKAKSANKSAAIRDYKTANAAATPKQIAEAISKAGMAVSAQFVSTVLSNAKKGVGKGKRGPKPSKKMPQRKPIGTLLPGHRDMTKLQQAFAMTHHVQQLVAVTGSTAAAIEALKVYERLGS